MFRKFAPASGGWHHASWWNELARFGPEARGEEEALRGDPGPQRRSSA